MRPDILLVVLQTLVWLMPTIPSVESIRGEGSPEVTPGRVGTDQHGSDQWPKKLATIHNFILKGTGTVTTKVTKK